MNRYRTFQFAILIALITLAGNANAAPIEWTVRGVSSNGTPLININDANGLLNGNIPSKTDVTAPFAVINFNEPKNPVGGLFSGDTEFPGVSPGTEQDFAAKITGAVTIPVAGKYTFGVSSDDGFSLQVGTFSMSHPGQRGPAQSYATFDFAQAGTYSVNLVYFQHHQDAELELFATSGAFTGYGQKGSNFQLIGSSATGALALADPGVGTSVPEPSGVVLVILTGAGLLLRRRRAA